MTVVLDASAVLAFLNDEDGADVVDGLLPSAAISAANWSEVAQKTRSVGADWATTRALLLAYDVTVAPVTADDAEAAAALWQRGSGMSLADRLCLALANRLDRIAVTADRAWGESSRIRQIR
ncbi:PIN domain-containing protein [Microbacterium album]|uniref:PIN domain-containing protein n=1 Tax=Microbacterium album TaxID=2053191 RepID=A0A917IJP5_9MICO|nr:PIN domain-containing protein [Microbacterium album]GGH51484.1 hypothetical protein GCM10010921_30930 [Microbacterium album]